MNIPSFQIAYSAKKENKYASKERYFSLAKMALEELRNTFINVFDTKELMETLIDKLPFKEFKVVSVQGSVKKFKANVKCNIQDVSKCKIKSFY